jgi:hypothetical protein
MTDGIYKHQFEFIHRFEQPSLDGMERVVIGVVADPENVDSEGRTISAEEIRTACYRFMEQFQNTGADHAKDDEGYPILLNDKLRIVLNWLTHEETKLNGKHVPKDAWLMGIRVLDDEIWQSILDGERTGFSFEASAKRIPIL